MRWYKITTHKNSVEVLNSFKNCYRIAVDNDIELLISKSHIRPFEDKIFDMVEIIVCKDYKYKIYNGDYIDGITAYQLIKNKYEGVKENV